MPRRRETRVHGLVPGERKSIRLPGRHFPRSSGWIYAPARKRLDVSRRRRKTLGKFEFIIKVNNYEISFIINDKKQEKLIINCWKNEALFLRRKREQWGKRRFTNGGGLCKMRVTWEY